MRCAFSNTRLALSRGRPQNSPCPLTIKCDDPQGARLAHAFQQYWSNPLRWLTRVTARKECVPDPSALVHSYRFDILALSKQRAIRPILDDVQPLKLRTVLFRDPSDTIPNHFPSKIRESPKFWPVLLLPSTFLLSTLPTGMKSWTHWNLSCQSPVSICLRYPVKNCVSLSQNFTWKLRLLNSLLVIS